MFGLLLGLRWHFSRCRNRLGVDFQGLYLEALRPKNGEVFYGQDWISLITQFAFGDDGVSIDYNHLTSFKLRKNMLQLIKNVLNRGSEDNFYHLFEKFSFLLNEKFEGADAPKVDKSSGIDDIELMNYVDSAMEYAFGYINTLFIKKGLLTFEERNGIIIPVYVTHDINTLSKFGRNFQLTTLLVGERKGAFKDYRSWEIESKFLSQILSGYKESVLVQVDNKMVVQYIKITPQDSEFLSVIFYDVDNNHLKTSYHQSILNQFVSKFYKTNLLQIKKSELFFEGRQIIISKIEQMLRDQVPIILIEEEFEDHIQNMKDVYGFDHEEAVMIKREQVIRQLLDFYKVVVYEPNDKYEISEDRRAAGDFAIHLRDMLKDSRIKIIPIPFGSADGRKYNHEFFDTFNLKFDIGYFTKTDKAKILPTLSYTFWAFKKDYKSYNPQQIKELFDIKVVFEDIKNRIIISHDLIYKYFTRYNELEDIDVLSVTFYKETTQGFGQHSKLKETIFQKYRNSEIERTSLQFNIKDDNGEIIESELDRFILNVLYYVNKYDCVANIRNGRVKNRYAKTALVVTPSQLLSGDYLASSYSPGEVTTQVVAVRTSEVYNTVINEITDYGATFSQSYKLNAESGLNIYPCWILPEGNADLLRVLFETTFRYYLPSKAGEFLIQDLQSF